MSDTPKGLRSRLTNYGDKQFSAFLRRSFSSSVGYGPEMLDRPITGICRTGRALNNCHRTMAELVEVVVANESCDKTVMA